MDALRGDFEERDGELVHTIDRVQVKASVRGEGFATRLHGLMVYWGTRLGITRLKLIAARTDHDIGYIVWPILGYDGPLLPRIRGRLPATLRAAVTLQELLRTDEGRDWWQAHGESMALTFDLRPGSTSLSAWSAYWDRLPETRKTQVMDAKSSRKPGELDPDRDYENGIFTKEELLEGWRWLGSPEHVRIIEDGMRQRAEKEAHERPR